jgi:short-subunit dehydrogenase
MNTQINKGTALITGASTGIGAVYADRLATRGYNLILVSRDQNRLKELASRLQAKTDRTVDVLAADLTQKSDLLKVEERLRTDTSITALVNNAGFGATSKLIESSIDDLENMIDLNVTALTRLTHAVLPGLVERSSDRQDGLIINIASIVALAPELLNGTYSGTKAYVVNFTQSLNHELAGKGIQVQAVLPGATSTEFWDRAGLAIHHLPGEIVMTAEDMVDASLAGLDRQELITIPALPDAADWQKFNDARLALGPNLSHRLPAARYGVKR